ncbi:ChaN family lipoprotein [Burkholderiaceae bacterium UC74_6]
MRKLLPLLLIAALTACASPKPKPRLDDAHFLLLGEVHDNAAIHDMRAGVLRNLLADGKRTVVVFEQMGRDRDAALAAAPRDAEAIADAGALDRKGWRWPLHKPVIDAALAGKAGIVGGNLERDKARALVRDGESAWPADLAQLRANSVWGDAQQKAMVDDIDQGHCGAMPAQMMPGMVLAQRGRDAAMAQAMLAARAAGAERVVLIAGNGHVRRDLAVPLYLRAAGVPANDIFSAAYMEQGMEQGSDRAKGAYDAVVRLPAAEREDPCKALLKK